MQKWIITFDDGSVQSIQTTEVGDDDMFEGLRCADFIHVQTNSSDIFINPAKVKSTTRELLDEEG